MIKSRVHLGGPVPSPQFPALPPHPLPLPLYANDRKCQPIRLLFLLRRYPIHLLLSLSFRPFFSFRPLFGHFLPHFFCLLPHFLPPMLSSPPKEFVAPVGEVHAFVVKCMQSVGTSEAHAAQLADLLLDADIVGHYSHGLNRLCIYIEDVASGVKSDGEPKVLKQKGATAWVDGCDLLGAVVGNFCTELAIKLAKEHGIGWVVCKRSNHYGICQHYPKKIANAGLLGLSFTNTSPIIFPTRSSQIGLGTNPISCCANSREKGDGFILDMAASTVALGKVEIAKVNGKSAIPSAWGADSAGRPSTDPLAVLDGGGLLPLGGVSEEDGSHKGTGIAMMGELFCGLLGGASFGKNVRSWREVQKAANLGQCFVAIDPECFAPTFVDNLQLFLDQTRGLKPRDPSKSVLVPGDPERMNSERSAKAGGVIYSEGQIRDLEELAKKQNVDMFPYKANL